MTNKRLSLCPACANPYLDKVEKIGLDEKTMYVHKIEAASSVGVRATGCTLQKDTGALLRFVPGLDGHPILEPVTAGVSDLLKSIK